MRRALACCVAGSLPDRIEMKMTLSTPRMISRKVSVTSASRPSEVRNASIELRPPILAGAGGSGLGAWGWGLGTAGLGMGCAPGASGLRRHVVCSNRSYRRPPHGTSRARSRDSTWSAKLASLATVSDAPTGAATTIRAGSNGDGVRRPPPAWSNRSRGHRRRGMTLRPARTGRTRPRRYSSLPPFELSALPVGHLAHLC